jgi:hypothetical protein
MWRKDKVEGTCPHTQEFVFFLFVWWNFECVGKGKQGSLPESRILPDLREACCHYSGVER